MAGPQNKAVDRSDFPSNSIKLKEEKTKEVRKKVEPVVKSKVTVQKKSLGKRISKSLFGDDTRGVGSYILYDVLIPAGKSMITEMVGGGIEMLVYGERQGRRTSRDRGTSYVSYDKASYRNGREREGRERDTSRSARARHDFDDILIETRGEAEDILSHLVDFCQDYGQATVADFYDLAGIESKFTDNKYGWVDLRGTTITHVRGGYLLNLPKTQQVD